jgi:hypothetical protein
MEEKGIQVITEAFKSETSYVSSLRKMHEKYIVPLRMEEDALLPKMSQLAVLLSSTEELLFLHTEFCSEWERTLPEPGSEGGHSYDEKTAINIAGIFLKYVPLFCLYEGYARNHEESSVLIEHVAKTDQATRSLLSRLMSSAGGRTLESYLTIPTERLPRYLSFLEDLARYGVENESEAYDKVGRAIEAVQLAINSVKMAVSTCQGDKKVRRLQCRYTTVDIARHGRSLLLTADAVKISQAQHRKRFTFMLFSDIVLYADKQRVHQMFELKNCSTTQECLKPCQLGLMTKQKSFKIEFKTKEISDTWAAQMSACILGQRKKHFGSTQTPKGHNRIFSCDNHCYVCSKKLGAIWSPRQNCNSCGKVVCAGCSRNKIEMWKIRLACERLSQHTGDEVMIPSVKSGTTRVLRALRRN